jgi:hypothetical protein
MNKAGRSSLITLTTLAILIVVTIIIYNSYTHNYQSNIESKIKNDAVNISCDSSLWEHVYHSYRLKVVEKCKSVTGLIELLRKEADGDYHILLRLDEGQDNLLNDNNYTKQKGCLVLEPVCVNKVTQIDAIESCKDFINNVYIPKKNEHVKVTGSYVLDSEHGWMEIHPVSKIEVLQ